MTCILHIYFSVLRTIFYQRDELFRTGKAPQIFYGARTHTQLAQMAKTLKTLPYVPTMATLGSR